MKTLPNKLLFISIMLALATTAAAQSSNPYADGNAAAPDEWLLVKKGTHGGTKPSRVPRLFSFKSAHPRQRSKPSLTEHAHWWQIGQPKRLF
jgi:hypothetical protein